LLTLAILQSATLLSQPLNDNCSGAINLTELSNWCSEPAAFTNIDATASPEEAPFCFPQNSTAKDVWFSFVAQANSVNIIVVGGTVDGDGGSLANPQVALFEGACGVAFNELECISDAFGDNIVETFGGPLTIGDTYYIRVAARDGNTGTFQFCIDNFNQVPEPESDCAFGVILCDKSPFTVQSVLGAGDDLSEVDPTSCVREEISSTWYKWTCDQPGSLVFTLTPNLATDDLDFLLYELPNGIDDCANKMPLRCMASGENVGQPLEQWIACTGATGLRIGANDISEDPGCAENDDNFVSAIDMVAGRSYALMINNFSNTGNGFSIAFGGTGTFLGPSADFQIFPDTGIVCDDIVMISDSSSFVGGSIIGWQWNFGSGAVPQTAASPGPHEVLYETVGTKSIALTIESDEGCIVTKIIELEVEACCEITTEVDLTLEDKVDPACNGTASGALFVSASGGTPLYQYSLDNMNFQNATAFQNLLAGPYTIYLRDAKGCADSIPASLIDPPELLVDAGLDTTITLGNSTDLFAQVIPFFAQVDYLWDPGLTLSCMDCPDPEANTVNTTTYTVTVTNENGCTATDEVTVSVIKDRPIYIPNAFSPNFDGVNDFFTAYGNGAAREIELLRVFNRWGAQVYEATNIPLNTETLGWDGRFKGELLTPDVFAYYIVIGFIDDESIEYEGDITILK
ncbi:MAG: gliding motility-associated C-terminal domain-containing protein, partial [Bacteroidota bacterium]